MIGDSQILVRAQVIPRKFAKNPAWGPIEGTTDYRGGQALIAPFGWLGLPEYLWFCRGSSSEISQPGDYVAAAF